MPERLLALKKWLDGPVGLSHYKLEPATDDASFRRYFRVTLVDGATLIAMDAPPENEACQPFVDIARQFAELGLHVPIIHAEELNQGFLLLDDLGSVLYLDVLDEACADRLYADALSALAVIQACGPREGLPLYDESLLRQEMALFPDWLLERQLNLKLTEGERSQLDELFDLLVQSALEQPRVCVHRDFHSRNLMVTDAPNPGIIDFQDAVIGPVTYDLVSLLRDCYISWPAERVRGWAMGYFELAAQSGILRDEHEDRFLRWFDLMGVQRQLKASGIFARLNIRDGKPGYLGDIPRTLGYIVEVAGRYPELEFVAGLIEQRVLPKL